MTSEEREYVAKLERACCHCSVLIDALEPRPDLRGMAPAANNVYSVEVSVNHLQGLKFRLRGLVDQIMKRDE